MNVLERRYMRDKKTSEAVKKVLTTLNGLTYADASFILDCAHKELRFTSFLCQDGSARPQ